MQDKKERRGQDEKTGARHNHRENGERRVRQEDDEEIERKRKRGAEQIETEPRPRRVPPRGQQENGGIGYDQRVHLPRLEIDREGNAAVQRKATEGHDQRKKDDGAAPASHHYGSTGGLRPRSYLPLGIYQIYGYKFRSRLATA